MSAAPYLKLLRSLLAVARPGSLFPDAAPLDHWLELLGRPNARGRHVPFTVHAGSGLPARRSLERLTRTQHVARAVLREAGARVDRAARAFSSALAASDLPPLSAITARLVARARGAERFVVVHERFDVKTGCPVRYTAQLEQRKARHLSVERGEQARVSERFSRELAIACDDSAEDAWLSLTSMEGLTVSEVVRGQLGPLTTALGGEAVFGPLVAQGGGVLALLLERAGSSVATDHDGDPWKRLDSSELAGRRREALGYRVSRERRLVCTPELEASVRRLVAATGRPLVVRSR